MSFSSVLRIGAAILSGILLLLSFPDYNLGQLAWIAFVPLFLAIAGRSSLSGFLLTLVTGTIFLVDYFRCNLEAEAYTYLHHALLAVIYGPLFAMLGLGINYVTQKANLAAALTAAPCIYVCLEFVRANLFFLAMPMGLLHHSQYLQPYAMQIAAITGAYGVSFLIVLVNSGVTAGILLMYKVIKASASPQSHQRLTSGLPTVVALALLAAILSFTFAHARLSEPLGGRSIKISVIQPNIPQSRKWDRRYRRQIMQTLDSLTFKAAQKTPQLIVWPEAATPGPVGLDRNLNKHVRDLAEKAGTYLLLGSTHQAKMEKERSSPEIEYRNSAYLISPDPATPNQRYDKTRLLPFAEYQPLKGKVPWSAIDIPNVKGYAAGEAPEILEIQGVARLGVPICWENIFPAIAREFVRKGAQVIINITNEAWFGRSAGAHHFLSISVLRAVENGVYVVRCTNTGVSCFIDSRGRIVDRLTDSDGNDLFVQGVLTDEVILPDHQTLYTQYGDVFVGVCFFVSVLMLITAGFRRQNQRK